MKKPPFSPDVYAVLPRSIKDGDTLVVDVVLGYGVLLCRQVLRLKDVHAPETHKPRSSHERMQGEAATLHLEKMIQPNEPLVFWSNNDERDQYGRLVGVLFKGELNINEEMVTWMKAHSINPGR